MRRVNQVDGLREGLLSQARPFRVQVIAHCDRDEDVGRGSRAQSKTCHPLYVRTEEKRSMKSYMRVSGNDAARTVRALNFENRPSMNLWKLDFENGHQTNAAKQHSRLCGEDWWLRRRANDRIGKQG